MKTSLRLAILWATLVLAGNAQAHAFLDSATPAVGSAVRGSPAEVTLRFTEELEPAFSKLQVLDASGKPVDKKDVRVDASDRRSLRVSLPLLPAGRYRVKWRVLSVDTHVTEGDFTFDVTP